MKECRARATTRKQRPFVSMTSEEFEEAFDDLDDRDVDEKILNQGRAGKCELLFAAVVLRAPGQAARLVHYAPEYGDGTGSEMMLGFAQSLSRLGLLAPEERVSVDVYAVELE